MSKTLWHTIKLEVPKEMVNITKNDKVVVKKSLTKTNNISKANKEPSIKIIPSDTNKPKIIRSLVNNTKIHQPRKFHQKQFKIEKCKKQTIFEIFLQYLKNFFL